MRLIGRRTPEPVPLGLAAVEKQHGRILAWGTTVDGRSVAATPGALVVVDDSAATGEEQVLPWHAIDVGTWEAPVLSIRFRDLGTGGSRRLVLEFASEGKVPPVFRDRVDRSVVVSRRIALVGDRGAVMAARKDSNGAISWTVVFDPGLNARDPELQGQAREALAELRRTLGA